MVRRRNKWETKQTRPIPCYTNVFFSSNAYIHQSKSHILFCLFVRPGCSFFAQTLRVLILIPFQWNGRCQTSNLASFVATFASRLSTPGVFSEDNTTRTCLRFYSNAQHIKASVVWILIWRFTSKRTPLCTTMKLDIKVCIYFSYLQVRLIYYHNSIYVDVISNVFVQSQTSKAISRNNTNKCYN